MADTWNNTNESQIITLSEKSQTPLHTKSTYYMILLHVFLENTHKSTVREQINGCLGTGWRQVMGRWGRGCKSAQEHFWGKWYVCYLGCGDSFKSYTCVKTHRVKHFKCVQFITPRLFLTKAEKSFKKKNLLKCCTRSHKPGLSQASPGIWIMQLYGHTHLLTWVIFNILSALRLIHISNSFKQPPSNHSWLNLSSLRLLSAS